MSFLVIFQGIPVWECFPTRQALYWSLTGMQVSNMQPQIKFPTTGDWAKLTLKDNTIILGSSRLIIFHPNLINRLVSSVNFPMVFETVSLVKPHMTYVALVWPLPRVDPEVTFQPENVRTGVCAVVALIRPLSSVTSNVSLQLAELH